MSDKLAKLLATFFYIGDLPGAPGTIASFAGILIGIIVQPFPVLYVLITIVATIVGFAVSGRVEKMLDKKDPGCIVIDEVAGVLIAFFALPVSWPVVITTFFLFRAFDMFKLYPVNKFDNIEGGTGIMLDDLVAGLYTNITMQIAVRWAGII